MENIRLFNVALLLICVLVVQDSRAQDYTQWSLPSTIGICSMMHTVVPKSKVRLVERRTSNRGYRPYSPDGTLDSRQPVLPIGNLDLRCTPDLCRRLEWHDY